MDSVGKEKIPFPSVSMVTGGERQNPDPQFRNVTSEKEREKPGLFIPVFHAPIFFQMEPLSSQRTGFSGTTRLLPSVRFLSGALSAFFRQDLSAFSHSLPYSLIVHV